LQTPYLSDAVSVTEALSLIEQLGEFASSEAIARADKSRDVGNLSLYCRWRQIAMMIELLDAGPGGTLH